MLWDKKDFHARLSDWVTLRETLKDVDVLTVCRAVNEFWKVPTCSKHHLHPADIEDWPGPWELIYDNIYCKYARGLGIIYTLMFLDIKDIDFIDAIDDNDENVCLVLVDNAKYTLNYDSAPILNMSLQKLKSIKNIDTTLLRKKIGND